MFCRNIFYIWNCVWMVTNVFTGVGSLPLAKHTLVSADSYVFTVTGRRLYSSQNHSWFAYTVPWRLDGCRNASWSFAKTVHVTVHEGSNSCSTVIETRLSHSENALLSEARRTGMVSLWSDSMMTVYNVMEYYWQNSPPQARKFLGFSTVRS